MLTKFKTSAEVLQNPNVFVDNEQAAGPKLLKAELKLGVSVQAIPTCRQGECISSGGNGCASICMSMCSARAVGVRSPSAVSVMPPSACLQSTTTAKKLLKRSASMARASTARVDEAAEHTRIAIFCQQLSAPLASQLSEWRMNSRLLSLCQSELPAEAALSGTVATCQSKQCILTLWN